MKSKKQKHILEIIVIDAYSKLNSNHPPTRSQTYNLAKRVCTRCWKKYHSVCMECNTNEISVRQNGIVVAAAADACLLACLLLLLLACLLLLLQLVIYLVNHPIDPYLPDTHIYVLTQQNNHNNTRHGYYCYFNKTFHLYSASKDITD